MNFELLQCLLQVRQEEDGKKEGVVPGVKEDDAGSTGEPASSETESSD